MENNNLNNNLVAQMHGCLKAVLITFGTVLILVIIINIFGEDSNSTITPPKQGETVNQVVVVSKKDSVKAKSLSSLFVEEEDKFNEITFVEPKTKPTYRDQNGFYCYFSKSNNVVSNFRFVGQYYGDDWLFVEKLIFNIDGINYEYFPGKVERDNDSNI